MVSLIRTWLGDSCRVVCADYGYYYTKEAIRRCLLVVVALQLLLSLLLLVVIGRGGGGVGVVMIIAIDCVFTSARW